MHDESSSIDGHFPDDLLRAMTGSLAIRFGTTAPHTAPRVYVGNNGAYAALGSNVIVTVHCRDADRHALIPVCRQAAFAAFGEAGLPTDGIDLLPTVTIGGRFRVVVDENPSSASHGRRKRLQEQVMVFDLDRATRRLLTREEAQGYRVPLVPRHERVLPDVTVERAEGGSLFLFRLHTQAAEEWVEENVDENAPTVGGALVVDHRYARDLAAGMIDADLKVR